MLTHNFWHSHFFFCCLLVSIFRHIFFSIEWKHWKKSITSKTYGFFLALFLFVIFGSKIKVLFIILNHIKGFMLIISYTYIPSIERAYSWLWNMCVRVCVMKLENVINLEYKYQTEINCPKIHIGHIWPESQMKYKHFPLEQRHFEYFLFSFDSVFRSFFLILSLSLYVCSTEIFPPVKYNWALWYCRLLLER